MIYRVCMDFSQVKDRLLKFNLGKYGGGDFPIVFFDAEDPDEACYLAQSDFTSMLYLQSQNKAESMIEMSKEIKEMLYLIKIKSVTIPGIEN